MNQKVVLVTGALGGIGRKICELFKKKGWYVIGTDYIKFSEYEKNKEYKNLDRFIPGDLVHEDVPKYLYDNVMNNEKKLDSLINVAAIQVCKPIIKSNYQDWNQVVNCNIRAIFFLAKFFYPLLKKSQGNIVNIASVHSVCTSKNISIYAMTKAALVGLTKSMAIEFGQDNIRVNAVSPGAINTEMLRRGIKRSFKDVKVGLKNLADQHIMKKIGEPLEIAKAVYFLSDNNQSSFLTGHNLVVDGGASIKLSTE